MLGFKWTFADSWALRKFIWLLTRYVVSTALFLVARLTEMSVSPAEPLGDGAAEFAFKLDEVYTVLPTLGVADSESVCSAFTTDQLFSFEFLCLLCCSQAIFQSTEVRILTCMTEVVSTLEDRILLQIVVIDVVRILEPFILVNAFVFGPLEGHLFHLIFLLTEPVHVVREVWMWVRELHQCLALRTIQEVEGHSWRWPSFGYFRK